MPSQPPPRNNNNYGIQWIHIDDFSAGCFSAGNTSPLSPGNQPSSPYNSAPLGAAYLGNTFACTSIAGGALGPLPRKIADNNVSLIGGIPGSAASALVAGLAITPQLANGQYEIVTILESDNGTNHFVAASSYINGVLNTITGPTITSATTPGFFGAPYPTWTRMTSGGTGNPPPVLAFPTAVLTDANGGSGHMWVYPTLASPSTFTAQDLITAGSSNTGQTIAYGSRVIATAGLNYNHPGSNISTNENFNYTDPPQSSTFGNQQTVLTIEAPWGYGAYGSVSVGELLLVKKYGGGLVLNGDINVPTSVIRFPAIQSTGNFVGQSAATPIGLVYCSQNQGAWVWNGGSTSNKISRNINDNFFDIETGTITSNNYGFNVARWQKWLLFSRNVLYDTETNAWWNLFPPGLTPGFTFSYPAWWYILTQNGYQMVTAPLQVSAGQPIWTSVFDSTLPAKNYQWQSLPINVQKSADRVIDVRQLIIRAGDPSSTGTATVNATIGLWSQTSTQTINIEPTILRFNVGTGAQGLDQIDLLLVSNNPSPGTGASAPIIHSIDIGYIVREGKAVND